jgi:hypothetical protein
VYPDFWARKRKDTMPTRPRDLTKSHTLFLAALALALAAPGIARAQAIPEPSAVPVFTVDGSEFAIQTFREDAVSYGNRTYVWKEVPAQLDGWQFTQTLGGMRARIEVTPDRAGPLFVAALAKKRGSNLLGWVKVEGLGFLYTDANRTPMAVYRKDCQAGERVLIPQGNWSGTIVLAPSLKQGKTLTIEYPPVPGVIIDASPDPQTIYLGSPSIAVLPNGDYVASHDFFGRGTTMRMSAVFGSKDRGKTWRKLADLDGQWWSTLFVHRGALYIIGTSERYGNVAIRRSSDGGSTWTSPKDAGSGLLRGDGTYHCAPMPVVVHKGRIWRAMEDGHGPGGTSAWPVHFRAFVMSAPVDADLLKAESWTCTNRLEFDPAWFKAEKPGWLEGNVVVTPEGGLVNILRFNEDRGDRATVLKISPDGKTISFDPATGFIDFPGGRTKFTIRYDEATKRYWSLVNKQLDPQAERNILALTSSADLRTWKVESTILQHPDRNNHGFQYVDWLFDGDDLIVASRTAWGPSHNFHDANYMTFHRVEGFRTLGGK